MNMAREIRKAGEHPVVEHGARVGYAASGVLHLLLAWLALRMAWGRYGGDADQSGAFEALASSGVGVGVLGVLGAGFVLLGVWNLFEGFVLRHELSDLVKHVANGITYGVLAWGAFEVAAGRDTDSEEQSEEAAEMLMENLLGTALVVVVGLVVIAVGCYLGYKGIARKYHQDLKEDPGPVVEALASFGYAAKGVALVVLGGLALAAAFTSDPEKAAGIDGALRALLELPAGKWLLTIVAAGLAAYALYSFVRSRYAGT